MFAVRIVGEDRTASGGAARSNCPIVRADRVGVPIDFGKESLQNRAKCAAGQAAQKVTLLVARS